MSNPTHDDCLPHDGRTDPLGVGGFDCVCVECGEVFFSPTPDSVCGRCDYLNGLDDEDDPYLELGGEG